MLPPEDVAEEWTTGRRPQNASLMLTIGHSTKTIEEFMGLLWPAGVTLLADVRRFPHSPRHPQFDEAFLSEGLLREGIGYAHLLGLGERRRPLPDSPNTGWRNISFRGYADHMGTPEFREGLEVLLELCGHERVCLMCSEAVWWRCHRRMISDALVTRGTTVEHILSETRRLTYEITPWAEVVNEDGPLRLVYPPKDPADAGNQA